MMASTSFPPSHVGWGRPASGRRCGQASRCRRRHRVWPDLRAKKNRRAVGRILIVQPVVPGYRRVFFEEVIRRLEISGHQVLVLTSRAGARSAARAEIIRPPWQREGQGFSRRFKGRDIRYRGSIGYQHRADLVVLELATGCLDTYYAITRSVVSRLRLGRVRSSRVVVWGHVGAYTRNRGRLLDTLEQLQIRGADHVLAYTPTGRDDAVRRGAAPENVSSLDNTVDLRSLESAVDAVVHADLSPSEALRRLGGEWRADVPPNRILAFIGALDAPKRINFLAAALDRLWERDPSTVLLVGGAGVDEGLLMPSVERGQTLLLGRIGDAEKALMARCASAIVMPGRVGLVATESFVLGLPVLTTDYPFHAPEFSYLAPGEDSLVLTDDPVSYADEVFALMNNEPFLARLQQTARKRSGWPTLEHMVQTFVDVCENSLASRF
ncbi:glycosyltransferase [Kocuria rosea]|uniref:D-inositol 3-phosphate glycosyltransferase n=1 Tax=Kocuria rosea TaxID=1275 RepID=A0A4R5YC72_KOCRO|nr:glycosyltransferase [Kocuria rosea]